MAYVQQALETIEHYKVEVRRVTDQLGEVKSSEQRKVWHQLGATNADGDATDGQVVHAAFTHACRTQCEYPGLCIRHCISTTQHISRRISRLDGRERL